MPEITHGVGLPQGTADLLNEVSRDVCNRTDLYQEGYAYLKTRFNPKKLHEVDGGAVADYSLSQCLIHAAATLTDEGLGRSARDSENQTRHKAIVLLAVLVWHPDAHMWHPSFAQFGGMEMTWGKDFDASSQLRGRALAGVAVLNPDDARFENWVALVKGAFKKLCVLPGMRQQDDAGNNQLPLSPGDKSPAGPNGTGTATPDVPVIYYIDMDQAAALVNRVKKTLARQMMNMPAPAVKGGGGKKHEWNYAVLKPWLERKYGKLLPDRPPHVVR